jgi:mannose-1-phosphate guanylyltransferase/mannose-6-phosphate isomerase
MMIKTDANLEVIPVILCGGSGTRLWPLSRKGFPKQFLVLSGTTSLFQQALERVNGLGNSEITVGKSLIVTNEEHRFLALEQLHELKNISADFLLEPSGKNTAPALTLAALWATQNGNDPILVVTPADQTIQNTKAFTNSLQASIKVADSGAIVVLGIKPIKPETGYGYIQFGSEHGTLAEHQVIEFTEKPNAKTAQDYLNSGQYAWNSGMFVLRASTWLSAIKQFRDDIYSACLASWQRKSEDCLGDLVLIRPNKEIFAQIPADSIDYAVIERCPHARFPIKMVELDAGWSDLGAWDAVWTVQEGEADVFGNVNTGDVLHAQSKHNLVHATSRLVATVGVENLVIIETSDAVLVASRGRSQEVKHIVAQLEKKQREEKNLHRKVNRPWGWYDSVDEGERFKVKRIQVKPGASLSLQMHQHRAEHWIVVKGLAEVTNGERVIRLKENESTYIPQGQKHRLSNPGTEPLEIIEVQSGTYLGEDDIVRFEDIYRRT